MRFVPRAFDSMVRLTGALVVAAVVSLAGCGPGAAPTCPAGGQCLRILFIGNSYTFVNDLPGTLAALAASEGKSVEVDTLAAGGATLADHVNDPATVKRLDSRKWDFVVLQEQSDTPAYPSAAQYYMFPAARTLVNEIQARGAKPLLFMTWGHRDGEPDSGMAYDAMQKAIDGSYLSIGKELAVPTVPVGVVWFVIRHAHSDVELWQQDGSHPTAAGTYLAACVFYAAIFRETPMGATYRNGLNGDTAAILQQTAADNVLPNRAEWGLQ
jgi:hypothetical protein